MLKLKQALKLLVIFTKKRGIKMENNLKELLEEVSLEEISMESGAGLNKAQCAWMAQSCLNYIPGFGWGCGGQYQCVNYKKYCSNK